MVLVRPLSASRLRRTNPQDHHSRLRILATVSLVFCAVLGWISWTSRVHDRLTIAAEERYVQFAGQPSQAPPLHLPPPAVELSSLRCEGTSGLGHARSELDGDVVIAGWAPDGSGLTSTTPQQCCFECERTRGCNVWVHCSSGECAGQCWLKHQRDPRNPAARGKGPGNPWTSGTLLRAFLDPSLPLPQADSSMATVVLSTSQGDIRLRLRPEWSESSVEYVRRVAVLGDDNCVQCQLYRVEPGFLLQGVLRTVLPPNKITTPGPKIMEMGEVGWAGGGPGPDFFIYLGERPAEHFGHDHTVWAEVADTESLDTAKRIVQLPSETPGGPGTMRFLQTKLELSVHPTA